MAFVAAVLGLGLLALLISYLPSIYASYARRQVMVTALETQAGSPPSGAELSGEYDPACCRLAEAGAPLRCDRDRARRDFVGWWVTYDAVLRRFASLCWAPDAPWSSDRAIRFHRAASSRRRARSRLRSETI